MSNKVILGCFFIAVSAFLYASKHMTAAIMVMNLNSTEANYFDGGYSSISTGISFWTGLSLLVGITLLLLDWFPAIKGFLKQKNSQKIKPPIDWEVISLFLCHLVNLYRALTAPRPLLQAHHLTQVPLT